MRRYRNPGKVIDFRALSPDTCLQTFSLFMGQINGAVSLLDLSKHWVVSGASSRQHVPAGNLPARGSKSP